MPGAVHRLLLPTPFAVGDVNCYLVDDEPLTLVDTGPNSATSLLALEAALAEHGRRVEDLERIVLTHQHHDHVGLAQVLVRRSGAELCGIELLASWLANHDEAMEADDRFAEELMARHGVPEEIRQALRSVSALARGWGAPAVVTQALADGDVLEFASRSWRVHHRPGHSPTDAVFHDEASGELICGDHLLRQIASKALMARPLEGEEVRQPALAIYIDSLQRTQEMALARILPGHGEQIEDHATLIAERLRMHERRADKLWTLIAERPSSAHELAHAMWGSVAVTHVYLTLSEILGHIDLLVAEGRVRELDDGEVVRFEATT